MNNTRPFVTLSYAQSADGRIATLNGRSERISGRPGTEFAHTLRRDNQALMVGIGTVLADDPLLTCRLPGGCQSPVRIILDSQLKIPMGSRIVKSAETYRTIIFCSNTNIDSKDSRRRALEKLQLEIVPVEPSGTAHLGLQAILDKLGVLGFSSLFVEGGATLITSFFRQNLVDRLCIVSAPLIIGRGTEAVADLQVRNIEEARQGHTTSVRQVGNDIIWDISFSPTPVSGFTAAALYFDRPYSTEVRTEQLQQQSGEELIRSRAIGISHGSERHLFCNTFPGGKTEDKIAGINETMVYPIKYGYMNAGLTPKGERVFAFFPHQDRFFYPREELIYFPDSSDFEDIVLYPSVETAYTIVLDTAPLPGERILLIGQGMIGLLVAEILAGHPGLHVAALEPDAFRRRMSDRLGLPTADPTQYEPAGLADAVGLLFDKQLPDKIIHVSGSERGLQQAVDCADFETLILEASWYGNRSVQLKLGENFHRKRLTLRSSQVSTLASRLGSRWTRDRRTGEVKEWMQRIRPSKYVTHRFPFSRAQEAYQLLFGMNEEDSLTAPREPVLQVLLIPDDSDTGDLHNGGSTVGRIPTERSFNQKRSR